jgi:hypothetical protein
MEESVSMPEFVEGLFSQPLMEQRRVRWEAVALVEKTVIGDDRHAAAELRLPEDIGENGDEQVF